MSVIRYGARRHVLVGTKGHPFERDAFFAVFESLPEVAYTQVEQPALQAFFDPESGAASAVAEAVEGSRAVTYGGAPVIRLDANYAAAVKRLGDMAQLFAGDGLSLRVGFEQQALCAFDFGGDLFDVGLSFECFEDVSKIEVVLCVGTFRERVDVG